MEERFSPRMYLDYYTSRRNITIDDIGVARVVVNSWSRRITEALAERVKAERQEHWGHGELYPLFTGEIGGQRVSFVHTPVGAPATIMMMEEMIACGAEVFLGIGYAGSLNPKAPVGTLVIPIECLREEGTSFHYLDAKVKPTPDPRLAELLIQHCQKEGIPHVSGHHWTIDAVYRELKTKIEKYRTQGIIGVDMETSAMYALGEFRKKKVCNLLMISDELWHEWKPAFGTPEIRKSEESAKRVVLQCLENHKL